MKMRLLVAGLLLWPLVSCSDSGTDIYVDNVRSVVFIQSAGGHGSGTIISSDGLVLTAAHVLVSTQVPSVVLYPGNRIYPAKILKVNPLIDLALLKIDTGYDLPYVRVRPTEIFIGERVYTIGNPRFFRWYINEGIVMGRFFLGEHGPELHTTLHINPGNSGGPIFNRYGEMIGMVNKMYFSGFSSMNIIGGVPVHIIVSFLEPKPTLKDVKPSKEL